MDSSGGTMVNSNGDSERPKPRGPMVSCKVLLLDGSDYDVEIPKSSLGQDLVDAVCEHISLIEKEYFSCSYIYKNVRHWIRVDNEISKYGKKCNWTFSFEMKYYPLDPGYLQEDCTRYLGFLQLRLDICEGRLPCSFVTQALLGAFAVQSDLGDYSQQEHGVGCEYIRDIKFHRKQNDELLEKVAELHATHRGKMPDEAELHYLDNARNIALYGTHMHTALYLNPSEDITGDPTVTALPVEVGVCGIGIVVFRNQIRIHRFQWAKILKFAYKKNKFMIKVRPDTPSETPEIITFKLASYSMAKRLYRIAVDHHGFFRLKQPDPAQRAQFPHYGSKFRYSGRTQFQVNDGREDNPKRPRYKIDRKASTRFIGAKSMGFDSNSLGHTDRAEQHIIEAPRTATLDLKSRMNRSGSIPLSGDDDRDTRDNRNLSVIDPGGNYGGGDGTISMQRTGVSYSKQPYQTEGPRYDQYGNPVNGGSIDYDDDDSTMGRPNYNTAGSRGSRYGPGDPRYQEDQRLLHEQGHGAAGQGNWTNGYNTTTNTTKTSTRTYTDVDGTIITEHITERNGVIEKRIEKRQKTVTQEEDDEFDYDKALRDAIQSVTDMNPDMSVQKIEIHTKTETSSSTA